MFMITIGLLIPVFLSVSILRPSMMITTPPQEQKSTSQDCLDSQQHFDASDTLEE